MILRTYIQIQVMLKRNLPMLLIHSWIIHFWCMVSQWINSHLESRLSDINIEWIWDGRTRNLYLGSSVGPPSPVDSISERTRSTSYSERRPSSSQFQELSFNTMTVHFRKTVLFETRKCIWVDFTVSQVLPFSKNPLFGECESRTFFTSPFTFERPPIFRIWN